MGFSRQEYWSRLPCRAPGDLPNVDFELLSLMSPEFSGGVLTMSHLRSPIIVLHSALHVTATFNTLPNLFYHSFYVSFSVYIFLIYILSIYHIFLYWASLVAQRLRICLQCRSHRRPGFDPWVRKIPWRRACQPTTVLLPGESHGQAVHRVAKSQTLLKWLSTHIIYIYIFSKPLDSRFQKPCPFVLKYFSIYFLRWIFTPGYLTMNTVI